MNVQDRLECWNLIAILFLSEISIVESTKSTNTKFLHMRNDDTHHEMQERSQAESSRFEFNRTARSMVT